MSGVEALYPFLYDPGDDTGATRARVVDEVRRSTREKVAETAALRQTVLATYAEAMAECATAMACAFAAGGRLFAFGNGGSSTDAQAVVATFAVPHGVETGTERSGEHADRGSTPIGAAGPSTPSGWPAIALTTDTATLTALSNDVAFEVVFARPLAASARPGDIAFGLSTSGGSANVLRGFAEARRRGMLTVGLAGYDGGRMAEAGTIDHLFVMPSSSVHRIQEAQTTVYQVLGELTLQALAAEGPG